ncbi:MAG: YitT family protein [Bacillota bacterium]|nr:YitT family protein [Bacillota bacterium]
MEKSIKTERIKSAAVDGLFFIFGGTLYATAIDIFTAPNKIAPGGITGISTMLNYLLHTPIGVMIFVLNIPLFIWGAIEIGISFFTKTIIATLFISVMIDTMSPFLPQYHGETILAAIFGGVLSGTGMSLIFMRGGTSGGTDIVAKLINKRRPFLRMGRMMLVVDMFIIMAAAVVYRNLESPMYAIIDIFVSTNIIDAIIYGTDSGTGKMMFIISEKHAEISQGIMTQINRGVTRLNSAGGYSGKPGEVILCALRRNEVYKTYNIIKKIDPRAFIIVGEAGEINGEGFKITP